MIDLHNVRGDRAGPVLPVAPHLRPVVDDAGCCVLFSRIDGRFPVCEGPVPLDVAAAALIAGES